MEWNIFGIMWYLFGKILIFAGICIGAFLIISFLLKHFYRPQSESKNETKI